MKLGQAVDFWSTVELQGYDGTNWTSTSVAKGAFLTFDRFITERSFGQKKRIFQTNSEGPIPSQYPVVRLPTGKKYMVSAVNEDVAGLHIAEHYNNVYLLQECSYIIEIMDIVTGTAASGTPAGAVPTVASTVFGDIERLSSARSFEFDAVNYTTLLAYMPAGTVVTSDNELRIGGVMYDILEHFDMMELTVAKVNKRAA